MQGGRIRPNEWMGAEKLRAARLRFGLSREEAATELGISKEMMTKMENGARQPSLKLAIKLHEFFSVPNPILGVTERSLGYIKQSRRTNEQ